MAFLGKISAVVTANTTDFTKKIEGTKQELMSLKRQLSGYQLNLNSRSLDGTLTKLQKFNRALQEAAKLSPFERLANGFPDLKRLADQFKLFEDVGKPLTKVKDQIEGLSNAVQAQLYPELEKTQKGFQRLFNEINSGDATFANSKKRIDNLLASLSRLGRVSAAASDIGQLTASLNASNTGASFFQPRTQEALRRSLALRGQAEQVPARLRTGVFADLSVDAERNAQKVEEQAARVTKALLEIERYGRTPRRVDTLANEQQSLERLTRQQEAINNQFQRELRGAQIKQIISPAADSQVESLVQRFGRLSTELREVNSSRFNGLISSVGSLVDQLNRGEVSAKKVRSALDGLASVRTAASIVGDYSAAADRALSTQQERDSNAVRDAARSQRRAVRRDSAARFARVNDFILNADSQIAAKSRERDDLIALRDAGRLDPGADGAIDQRAREIAELRRRRDRAAAASGRLFGNRQSRLAGIDAQEQASLAAITFNRDVAGRQSDLQQRASALGLGDISAQLEDLRKSARNAKADLDSAIDPKNPAAAANAIDSYKSKLVGLSREYDSIEKKITSAESAQKRFAQFLQISGSRGDKLGADLDRAASDIAVARQFAGNFGANNQAGRNNVAAGIERSLGVYQKATELQQRIFDRTFKSEEARQRALQKTTAIIEAQRRAIRDLVVEESRRDGGPGITGAQFDSAADAEAKNRGSFGARGAAVAQLAVQQGLFAIDDLLSSTGGLEYKLRAVGNNITQLGLLLGQSGVIPGLSATAGLAIGLATVIGGQLLSAFLRFASGAEEADRRVKVMNDSMNAQRQAAERLADAFRKVADAVASVGTSDAGRTIAERARSIEDITRAREDGTRDRIAALGLRNPVGPFGPVFPDRPAGPTVTEIRAQRDADQAALEKETSPTRRIELQARIRESAKREQEAIDRLSRSASSENTLNSLSSARSAIGGAQDALDSLISGALSGGLGTPLLTEAQKEAAQALNDRLSRAGVDAALAVGPNVDIRDPAQASAALVAVNGQIDAITELLSSGFVSGLDGVTAQVETALQSLVDTAARLSARLDPEFQKIDQALLEGAFKIADSAARTKQLLDQSFGGDFASSDRIQQELDSALEVVRGVIESQKNAATPELAAGFQQDIDALLDHINALRAAAGAVKSFASEIDKSRESVNNDANTAQQRAEQARRADIRLGTPETRQRRAVAEEQARNAEAARREFEDARAAAADRLRQQALADRPIVERLDVARRRGELASQARRASEEFTTRARAAGLDPTDPGLPRALQEAAAAGNNRLAEELNALLEQIVAAKEGLGLDWANLWDGVAAAAKELEEAQKAAASTVSDEMARVEEINTILAAPVEGFDTNGVFGESADRREELRQERARLQAQIDAAVESSPEVEAARRRRDDLTRDIEDADSAARGRELRQTPAERAARETQTGLNDIFKSFVEDAEEVTGLFDRAGFQDAASRFVNEQARSAAPAIFSLADSVENAILQGPSRAALRASDISTVEGQQELNRLLRGDDSARDQNIVELEKQNQSLQKLVDLAQEEAKARGIVLDFR